VDVVSTASGLGSTISWGPYILLALGGIGVVTWYAFRRILARIDTIGRTTDQLTIDVAVLKDRQKLTAAKVGVPAKQLQDQTND
jgi:hypothetical protein